MCGLAGILSLDCGRYPVPLPLLRRMGVAVAHRGPDGEGDWIDGERRIGLAHRRLAIIDLADAARQPMADAEGRFHIIYNGEIWNHRALRAELVARGHLIWRTDHSDTEVILNAFREWGIGMLAHLEGMFAIALWDAQERALWLIRDRVGVKPLYYARDARRLLFGSEIKALLADPEQPRRLDEECFFHVLTFLAAPPPLTLFQGIRKVAAGSWVRIDAAGGLRECRYWDPLAAASPLAESSDAAIAERVLATLRGAVRKRKVGDVPIGVFLSGGIDSSTNVALFSEDERSPVRTFSIGYDADYASAPDELLAARRMAQHWRTEHHEKRIGPGDLLAALPEIIHLQDEPIADPVCIPLLYLSRLARDAGVKVCQIGEGADELFWGYHEWHRNARLQSLADRFLTPAMGRAGLSLLRSAGKGERLYCEYLRRAASDQPVSWGGADVFTDAQKRFLLSPRLRERFRDLTTWDVLRPYRQAFEEGCWDPSPLNWMTYVDLSFRLPELLLMRVDKMSMGAGLEAREPFLDPDLVALALSIPSAVKRRGGVPKAVLRQAVRTIIPREVLDRPKRGFTVPIKEWFAGPTGAVIRDAVRRFAREADVIDPAGAERLFAQGRAMQSWYLANIALWWVHFICGESVPLEPAAIPA